MLFQVLVSGHTIAFTDDLPPGADEYLLYGSRCFYAAGRYGTILAQYLSIDSFSVLYTNIRTAEDAHIQITYPQPLFCCHINMQQQLTITAVQGRAFQCKRHSVALAFTSFSPYVIQVKKKREYQSVSVIYPLRFVLQQLAFFPLLDELRQKIARNKQTILPNVIVPLPVVLSNFVYQLLHLPVLPLTISYYKETLKELFREICRRLSKKALSEPYSSIQDVESIRAAKEWIDTHLDKHFTISQLAQQAGINEFKLKKGFRELYHIGLYGYLLRQRLLIAKAQLEETNIPVREIARQAGYKSINSFSSAFKRAYTTSPYYYRQQHRRL